jgi:hypothetical protein
MDINQLNEVIQALNKKNVNQPCPRCATNNFTVVGESEITVMQPAQAAGLLAAFNAPKTTMPIIVVTCDHCGYIFQHAQLKLLPPRETLTLRDLGLAGMRQSK